MMPVPGTYEYRKISAQEFVQRIKAADDSGQLDSYIGYQQTADMIFSMSGVKVKLSRNLSIVKDGDQMLIIKLAYRLDNPAKKGQQVEADYEYGLAEFRT
jgi:hypothetical protein